MLGFIIPGELPALNEIIEAAKSHYGAYSKMKKTYTDLIAWLSKNYPNTNKKYDITVTWVTKDLKKDPDNIACGVKFILDGLVCSGVLKNDTRKYVNSIKHMYELDKNNPRIEVVLEEVQ